MGRHGVATKLFLALLCVGFCIVIYQYFVLKGNDLVESIKKTTFRKAYHGDENDFQDLEGVTNRHDWILKEIKVLVQKYQSGKRPQIIPPLEINKFKENLAEDKTEVQFLITEKGTTQKTVLENPYKRHVVLPKKANNDRTPSTSTPGVLNVHFWDGFCGSRVEDLKRNIHFPYYPSERGNITKFFTQRYETGFGQRIFGYLHPPETGNFTFAVSCDDNCEVWLSTSEDPADVHKIAYIGTLKSPANTKIADFQSFPSQISKKIPLDVTKKYYVEVLHKQGAYKDHVLLTWLAPSWERIRSIQSKDISSFITVDQRPVDVNEYKQFIPVNIACKLDDYSNQIGSVYYFNRSKHNFTAYDIREDFFLTPSADSSDFDNILPEIEYSPSYVLDFVPRRYEGVSLVHECGVYPDDLTKLTHMVSYESCYRPRRTDSHYRMLHKKAQRYGGGEEEFDDYENSFLSGVSKRSKLKSNSSAEPQPTTVEDILKRRDRRKKATQFSKNDNNNNDNNNNENVKRDIGNRNSKNENSNSFPLRRASDIRDPKNDNDRLLGKSNAKRMKRSPPLRYRHLGKQSTHSVRKLLGFGVEPGIKSNSNDKLYINNTKGDGSQQKFFIKEDFEKRYRRKRVSSRAVHDKKGRATFPPRPQHHFNIIPRRAGIKTRGRYVNSYNNNKHGGGSSDKAKIRRRKPKIKIYKSHVNFKDGQLLNMTNRTDLKDRQLILHYYPMFGSAIYYLLHKYQRLFMWRYNIFLSKCKTDGNLPLYDQVAVGIVNQYMKAVEKKHGRKYTLRKIVNVEENHDVMKGDRYFIELELAMKGKVTPVRLSKYIYRDLVTNELYEPAGFKWNPKATVHVIVPVKDQGRWVQHFIDNMEKVYLETSDDLLNVIIVDFNSADIDIKKSLEKSKLKRYNLIQLDGAFQRALGLQAGADIVTNEDDILFTCDLHLDIPALLIDSIRKHTIKKKMGFAPIVHRLSCGYTPELPYGLWEIDGYGLFSISKFDFDRIGGMNTKEFKTKWGGEDWEFLDRALGHGLEVERLRIPKFFHHYHSKKKMWVAPPTQPPNNTHSTTPSAVGNK